MFRHQGKTRTLRHNKKIASLLSFVAGTVNIIGFLSVQRLTTNVTGHFAFFIDDVFKLQFARSLVYFFYIASFFLGSFAVSLSIEALSRRNERFVYSIPTLTESFILSVVALTGPALIALNPDLVACMLLFAMGLQNALVTRISGAMVRTTHLTGLFTDLGIELAQLWFHPQTGQQTKLVATIRLRIRIIAYFFAGGIVGGIGYSYGSIHALLIPAILLLAGLVYDNAKVRLAIWKRRQNRMRNV